tara:strand:- start:38332 stop:39180 length:849 start_codon:yes stop_codon:yes gene_type:complete
MADKMQQAINERARKAAETVVERLDLDVDEIEFLASKGNVLFLLHPLEIVARVSGQAARLTSHVEARTREFEVARYLASTNAPVAPPSNAVEPRPHTENGLVVTFWDYVEDSDIENFEAKAISALQDCHKRLAGYDGDLPFLQGYEDGKRLFLILWRDNALSSGKAGNIVQRIAALDKEIAEVKGGDSALIVPLHGDAHPGNTLCTPDGEVLWNDWEDTCCGPIEWDYACLVVDFRENPQHRPALGLLETAMAETVDPDRLDLMIRARELQLDMWDETAEAL